MIVVSSPMQQNEITELLTGYDGGDFTFHFKEKSGIRLFFEVTGDNREAARKARELIKATPWGAILYFQSIAAE